MSDVIKRNSPVAVKGTPARVRHTTNLTGIARMYCSERDGYYVRVGICRNRKIYRKDFWKSRCGGKQNAFKLAQAWRDMIIVRPPPDVHRRILLHRSREQYKCGVPGVSRNIKQHCARDGSVSARAYWQARVPTLDGNYRNCSFAVLVYGEAAAKQHAIDAHLQGLRAVENIAYRANALPLPVSTEENISVMVAVRSIRRLKVKTR